MMSKNFLKLVFIGLAFFLGNTTIKANDAPVPAGVRHDYLDLNAFGLKGDNTDESAKLQEAIDKATKEGLTITGKGVFNLGGKTLEAKLPLKMEGKKRGEFVIRNGNYILASSDIYLNQVSFNDFKTAAFYYPPNTAPGKEIIMEVVDCDFINDHAAIYSRGESYNTILKNSRITGSSFINSNYAAIYLKFNYRDLLMEKNVFEGVSNNGKKLVALVIIGVDSTGGGDGLKFCNNTIRNIVHPGTDINYTVLAMGDHILASGNLYENITDVAFYARGDNSTVIQNTIINNDAQSTHAIIAKKARPSGTINISENIIRGKFSTAIYIDSRFKTANIDDNEINLDNPDDSSNYNAVRILGHERHEKLNINGNSIKMNVSGKRSVCIRINGLYFDSVNIENNKELQSNGGILLTGKNDAINELNVNNNNMKAGGPSPVRARNLSFRNNQMNFELEGRNGFRVEGTKGLRKENNRVKD